MEHTDVTLYIYPAADPATILNLTGELAKLMVYRISSYDLSPPVDESTLFQAVIGT